MFNVNVKRGLTENRPSSEFTLDSFVNRSESISGGTIVSLNMTKFLQIQGIDDSNSRCIKLVIA